MQLHLVTLEGAQHTFVVNAGLYIDLNPTPSQFADRQASLRDSLKRIGIPHSTRHLFLLEHRYEDRKQIRYWLFVPEPHTTETFTVDDDRTYIENNGADQWTKGMESSDSRFFSLFKMRTDNTVMVQGYGEASLHEPARSWFIDLINEAW